MQSGNGYDNIDKKNIFPSEELLMKYYTEWRLLGDNYNDGFSNGSSLSGSESVKEMKTLTSDEHATVFIGKHGHTVKCVHECRGDVTDCYTIFDNTTDSPATIELLSSFAIGGIKADKIHRATSFWSAEGKLLSQDLTDLNMEPSWANHGFRIEKFGQIGSMPVRKWFPFLVLEDSESGEFTGIQLYCASSWQIEVITRTREVTVTGGLADRDYGSWSKVILPGESFTTPKAVVARGNSLCDVCDKLVKAQSPRIAEVDRDMPVIFNEYCTTWGNPTLENLTKTAKRLEGSGVRYLVIDCGWYRTEKCNNWFSSAGDWIPSPKLFPNGIGEAADMIRSHGLIPGIWFELENVGAESEYAFGMTDHLLKRDGYPVTVGARRFWDMRDPWVKNYLEERVTGLLRDAGFGYLKIDYNENIGAGADGAESYGEALRQSIEASRDFIRSLHRDLPDLVIENCSSGGHRLEPSMMELCSQASFSDAHESTSIPIIAANLHRLIRPEQSQIWAVLRANADIHRINYLLTSAFLGRLCLSGEIFDLKEEAWAQALASVKFYDRIKYIIRDGKTTLIRTNVKDYSSPEGYQAVLRELDGRALLVVHTFGNGANPPICDILDGYKIVETFGSELDGDFRGKAFVLEKE